jgi:hypothetical protein
VAAFEMAFVVATVKRGAPGAVGFEVRRGDALFEGGDGDDNLERLPG